MQHKRLKLCAVLLVALGLSDVQAQESINTAGGNAIGNGGSASYSVGQMVYTTNTGSTGSVAQGVQQAFEISLLSVTEIEGINISLSAYPNPTTAGLTLEILDSELPDLNYQVFDLQGRLLQSQKITRSRTHIELGHLATATYLVKVNQGNKEVKTFQIIKN